MEITRSLALDLAALDLGDRDALARFFADHLVGPARAAWGLPEPRPGERLDEIIGGSISVSGDLIWFAPTPDHPLSPAFLDPLVRGYVLFLRLLPGALATTEGVRARLNNPARIYFEASRAMAAFGYDDLEQLADGLLGRLSRERDPRVRSRRYAVERNDAAMAELAEAAALVRRCLATPGAEPDILIYTRHDVGLRQVGYEAARELDEILRADVHARAVWLADVELLFPGDFEPDSSEDEIETRVDDLGVYPTSIAETIRGVVALDFVSTFSRPRSVGICGHCRGALILSAHQVGRVDAGEPVYHESCAGAHRRLWMRDYQRSRRSREMAAGVGAGRTVGSNDGGNDR